MQPWQFTQNDSTYKKIVPVFDSHAYQINPLLYSSDI